MKYCNKCGAPLEEGQKVCTQCGTPVHTGNDNVAHTTAKPVENMGHSSMTPREPKKMTKQQKILLFSIIGALVLLFAVYKVVGNSYDVENKAEKVASAIRDDNPDKLSKLVTNGSKNLTETEAKAYIKFVKAQDNNFYSNLKNNAAGMKDMKLSESQVYADEHKVLDIHEAGKAMGLFKRFDFIVPQRKIELESSDVSDISYDLNGENKKVHTAPGKVVSLGTFPLGDYDIKATKTVDNKKYKGKLVFDMSNSQYAEEDFGLGYYEFQLQTNVYATQDNEELFVDGKKVEANDSNKVGPFVYGKKVEVYGKADLDGEPFETEKIEFTPKEDDEKIIYLSFDDDQVNEVINEKKNIEAKKSEEQESRKNIYLTDDDFYDDYMKQNRVDSYNRVKVGMKESEVEDVLGESDAFIDSSNKNLKAYGNMGVEYKDGKVEKILIVPDSYSSLDYDDIEEYYGTPVYKDTNKDGDRRYYLDGNKSNGFVIVIVMNDDDEIKYMYQKVEEASDPWR